MNETSKREYRAKAQDMANSNGVTIMFFFAQGMPWFVNKKNIDTTSEYKSAEYSEEFNPCKFPQ